ncbi:neutral zinc metallopeptidase [Actinosynnema pretiosum subsp. pretiosum]|uniref:Neutral zinc metallopeptidase n=1 Tax=Actinosynnema pretiosum subsp. pretiosum TaxID=103721 RepID=A0AA45R778_9PSEU|nr:YpfJ protein, zinc metalloprotease superfamily [Actinosynnema pretiosum subsp. pretiosum]QUF07443.1 neutral zinc metallopeptidase [Actinosynnema pretiosum subsp. pretiosum]
MDTPERRGGNPLAVVSVFAVVVAGVLGLAVVPRLGLTRPVEGRAVAAAPIEADPASGEPEGNRPRSVYRLGDHPLLTSDRRLGQVTCELPAFGTGDEQLAAFYRAGVVCLDRAWEPVLAEAGLPFATPELNTGPELEDGPCGAAPSADEAVAYYCGSNRTVYMPTARLRAPGGGEDRASSHLATLAHEYGHHVQALAGMLRAGNRRIAEAGETDPAGLEMSRRLELQANCFAGMFLASASGRGSVDRVMAEEAVADFRYAVVESPERNGHGSPANQDTWARAGFGGGTSACNTFTADAGAVG